MLPRPLVQFCSAPLVHFPSALDSLNPQDSDAYLGRGVAYAYLNQYERAIQDFDEAIRLNPEYANAYLLRGVTYKAFGKSKKAEQDIAKANELGYEP